MAMAAVQTYCLLKFCEVITVKNVKREPPVKNVRRRALAAASSLLVVSFAAPTFAVTTPYSQVQEQEGAGMEVGLLNGKIRPCPSDVNPNCVSTSSLYGTSAAFPWTITKTSSSTSSIKEIEEAVMSIEKNASILDRTSSERGEYLAMEVDGFLGRDVLEFFVRGDTVTYRSMAKKVVYVYPFTTPLTDFSRQEKRLKQLQEKLGWGLPEAYEDYLGYE